MAAARSGPEVRIVRVRASVVTATMGAGIAYSWVAAGLRPFTWPMRLAVVLPILVVLALAWGRSEPGASTGRGSGSAHRLGFTVWAALFAGMGGWQLVAYLSSPRHDYPTLSSLANDAMSTHAGRATFFALWLALGWAFLAHHLARHHRLRR